MVRKKKEINTDYKDDKERSNALNEVLKEINKDAGETVIQYASDEKEKETLSTGIKEIDNFIGEGLVRGNFSVVYGSKSVGKSTFALHCIQNAQKEGKTCVYIDLEHAFDKTRAKSLGIDLEKLILVEGANTAEEAMDIVIKLSKRKVVDLIVVDSIQAMSPKGEQETKTGKEKSVEDDEMALLARKLGKFFRVASTPVYKGNVCVLMIGQVRTTGLGTFIVRDGLSGGKALEHWGYQILHVRRGQKADSPVKEDYETYIDPKGKERKRKVKTPVGFDTVLKLEKTKSSKSLPENSEIHLPFYYESGFAKPKDKDIEKEISGLSAKVIIEDDVMPEEQSKKKKRGRPKKNA